MLRKTSKSFKNRFLLEFMREILRSTDTYIKLKVKHESKKPLPGEKFKDTGKTEEQKEKIKKLVTGKIKRDEEALKKMPPLEEEERMIPSRPLKKLDEKEKLDKIKPQLKVPILRTIEPFEPSIPHTIKDIQPVPRGKTLYLGKLEPLTRDPLVKTFESNGPNQPVVVTGMMGRKDTSIKLNQNEIQGLIKRFADEAKVPFEEGFFKAAVGNLAISAIISEATGSKFVITKLSGHKR